MTSEQDGEDCVKGRVCPYTERIRALEVKVNIVAYVSGVGFTGLFGILLYFLLRA